MTLAGAVAMLLAGMRLLAHALAAVAGGSARSWLATAAATPARAFTVGVVATAMLQSSSATTLLLLGLVAAGWIDDTAALLIVMGANVGTTLSSQLLAVPAAEAAAWLYVAAALVLLAAGGRAAKAGLAALGLALVLDGLARLDVQSAVHHAGLTRWLHWARSSPGAALVGGVVVTTLIDSSSAAVALAQRLAATGALGLDQAFRFVYGADIGTTTATLLASLPLGAAARRAAVAHVLFNVFSAAVFWHLTAPLAGLLGNGPDPARAVAHLHLLLNAVPAALLWPWHGRLAAALRAWVP